MIGKVNDACLKYMTLINIRYLSSQIQQFKLRGNFQNGRFPLMSMLMSLKNCPGVVGWCECAVYLTSPGRPTDIGLQLGKACYPCSG